MITKKTIEANVDMLRFGYWDDESDTFIALDHCDKDKAMEILGINPVLLRAFNMFASEIVDLMGRDLRDIWKRLDKMEHKIGG